MGGLDHVGLPIAVCVIDRSLEQARSVWLSGLSGPSGSSHAAKQTRQTE